MGQAARVPDCSTHLVHEMLNDVLYFERKCFYLCRASPPIIRGTNGLFLCL